MLSLAITKPGLWYISSACSICFSARQRNMRITISVAVFTLAACGMFSPATSVMRADVQTWDLDIPLIFSGGGSLTGTFQYDASTNTYSNLQLQMTQDFLGGGGGEGIGPWGPSNIGAPWDAGAIPGVPSASGPSTLLFGVYGFGPDNVWLDFANPLTNSATTDFITEGFISDTREFSGSQYIGEDDISVKQVAISVTPEPRVGSILLVSALILIGERWRRSRQAKTKPSTDFLKI